VCNIVVLVVEETDVGCSFEVQGSSTQGCGLWNKVCHNYHLILRLCVLYGSFPLRRLRLSLRLVHVRYVVDKCKLEVWLSHVSCNPTGALTCI
jgi:hypothetical protein